jgi:polysaccharide chain length determinant protein (PEP-CTERM system associated)
LSVINENPQLAMMTASRLASYFIDENLKSREQQAVGTSEFLESQLQETKARLEAQEERVKQYKLQYMGELPQQLQANLQILSRLQDQLKMNSDAIRRASDQKVFLESQIGLLGAQLGALKAQVPGSPGSEPSAASNDTAFLIANELAEKKSQLAALSSRFTEQYPELRRLKGEITELEKQLEEANRNEGGAGTSAGTAPRRAVSRGALSGQVPGARERGEILSIRAKYAAIDSEIASLNKDRQGIERTIAGLEARVEKSPRREQEMVSLTRDYENLKASYDDLLKKKLDADVSQNLEKRQKGEQFQILDPANLPQEPFTPNRPKIIGIAFAVALLVGFGGAIGFEMINPTLRGKRDFQHFFPVPVLGSIPAIRDKEYETRKRGQLTVVYGGLISLGVLVTVFLIVYGQKVRDLLQAVLS